MIMAADNKLVSEITARDVDFAQWYTDVVKKAGTSSEGEGSRRGICPGSRLGHTWRRGTTSGENVCKTDF